MKLLLNADVFGWKMTGLLGAKAAWFLGFSSQPKTCWRPTAEQIAAAGEQAMRSMRERGELPVHPALRERLSRSEEAK